MRPGRLLLLCLASGSALGAACDRAPAAPEPAPRVFGLQSVGGAALPVVIAAGAGETTYVTGGGVALTAHGVAAILTVTQVVRGGVRQPPVGRTDSVPYTEQGTRVLLGPPDCPPTAACVKSLTGTLDGLRLTLVANASPPEPAWVYFRFLPD